MNDNEIQIKKFFDLIEAYIAQPVAGSKNVVEYLSPTNLRQKVPFEIQERGEPLAKILNHVQKYFDFSVKTGDKQFLNQLYSGFNLPAFMGDVVTSAANTSMYTYEVAPVATEIEREMIRLMNTYTGYSKGDGIFVTGGSNANLNAMLSARNRVCPDSRINGLDTGTVLKAFVSEQAHYSFETAANIIGIGAKNVVKIQSDSVGRMIPAELEKAIEQSITLGETPFFVGATCATTLLGAFDPLGDLAAICRKHKIWLHADGSFGGSIILSPKHRHLFKGIEKTDSFAWNPHKLMNIPLICSVFLVKKPGTLQHNITDINTDYIFHDIDEVEDLGKKSIQCGRRVDAVKLWFAWKYFGIKGYEGRIDNLMEVAGYAEQFVIENPKLELLVPRQSLTVCFRYLPNNKTNLNKFNLQLREALRKSGKSIVNYGYIDETLAIRLVVANGELTKNDLDRFFYNYLLIAKEMEGEK